MRRWVDQPTAYSAILIVLRRWVKFIKRVHRDNFAALLVKIVKTFFGWSDDGNFTEYAYMNIFSHTHSAKEVSSSNEMYIAQWSEMCSPASVLINHITFQVHVHKFSSPLPLKEHQNSQMGQKRPRFCVPCAKKYTDLNESITFQVHVHCIQQIELKCKDEHQLHYITFQVHVQCTMPCYWIAQMIRLSALQLI